MRYMVELRWTAEAETPEQGDEIMRAAARCKEICRLMLDRPAMGGIEDSVEGTITVVAPTT